MVSMIIVDSNVLIFGELENAPENKMAIAKLTEVLQHDRVGLNTIIASEVFHKLQLFCGRVEAAAKVSKIFSNPNSDFFEFTPDIIIRATKLARDFQMRINDALIAQQAIETGASILTDNVKDFKKIKSIKVLPLRA